jgi:transposase InsO family protein
VTAYAFIEAEKQEPVGNVAMACRLLEVSRSAFYAHLTPSRRRLDDVELTAAIRRLHEASKGVYGAPRIRRDLADKGVHVGTKRVARLMRAAGLAGRCRRRFVHTTIADPAAVEDRLVDLIKRQFGPEVWELDQAWCGDITYIPTWEGWLYLATVIDLGSRRVVGYAMADHLRTDLVTDALTMALNERRPAPGVIFHADRGCQYTSGQLEHFADDHGIVLSFSRKGQCWDNAVAESFFATLKDELIYRQPWATRASARAAIFDYIEVFYNRRRRHSSLGGISPAAYENIHRNPAAQAA